MNSNLIKAWIKANRPNGRTKFAKAVKISVPLLDKIVHQGHSPNLKIARRIADFLNVTLDEIDNSPNEDTSAA
jgi:transcriptional regulator with XRE-family HTH domain